MIDLGNFLQQLAWIQANESLIGENDATLEDILNRPLKELLTLMNGKNIVLEEDLDQLNQYVRKTSRQALVDEDDVIGTVVTTDNSYIQLKRGDGSEDRASLNSFVKKNSRMALSDDLPNFWIDGNTIKLKYGNGGEADVNLPEISSFEPHFLRLAVSHNGDTYNDDLWWSDADKDTTFGNNEWEYTGWVHWKIARLTNQGDDDNYGFTSVIILKTGKYIMRFDDDHTKRYVKYDTIEDWVWGNEDDHVVTPASDQVVVEFERGNVIIGGYNNTSDATIKWKHNQSETEIWGEGPTNFLD